MIALATTIAQHPLPFFAGGLSIVLLLVAATVRVVQTSSPTARFAREGVVAAAVVVLAIGVFAVLATGLDGTAPSVRFDEAITAALQQTTSPPLARIVASVTHLGDRDTLIALVIAIGGLLVAARRHVLALAWTLTCAGNGVLNPALKSVFERARPLHDAAYATVGEYSFPSGHTSGSVVVYGMLAYLASRLVPSRWHLPIVLAAAILICTVGCSRIYLRVHWASDVVAGFASGLAWLVVCIVITERFRSRRPLSSR